ncbi:DUF1731 domain-containing protein [Escherichia coli]
MNNLPMRSVMRSSPGYFARPATAIRLLMGESSVLVLGGQRALPKRLEEAGFAFRWYDLEEALADVDADVVYCKHPPATPGVTGLVALRYKIVWR